MQWHISSKYIFLCFIKWLKLDLCSVKMVAKIRDPESWIMCSVSYLYVLWPLHWSPFLGQRRICLQHCFALAEASADCSLSVWAWGLVMFINLTVGHCFCSQAEGKKYMACPWKNFGCCFFGMELYYAAWWGEAFVPDCKDSIPLWHW